MIGNDLVDLNLARQSVNWQRPRFLAKIFTSAERTVIQSATAPSLALWFLWSQKESVYKMICRSEGRRFFAPKQFACDTTTDKVFDLNIPIVGTVFYKNLPFQTKTIIHQKYIYTVAQADDANVSSIHSDIFKLSDTTYPIQHQRTRQKLLHDYARLSDLAKDDLSIQKDQLGVPYLYYQQERQAVYLSISHHGHYGSYALKLMQSEMMV